MVTVFNVLPDNGYAVLTPADKDAAEFKAKMTEGGLPFYMTARGIPLEHRWNDDWEFVENNDFARPKGLGDLAEMNKLIATRERGFEVLAPLIGDSAEVLRGKYGGEALWLFNVNRRVEKSDIDSLDDGAIFRVNPHGMYVLCGPAFKSAVERSGLTGLKFREILPTDKVPLI